MPSDSQFQYSARDFDTIKRAIKEFLLREYPTRWTDFSDSNAGMPLIDVIAYTYSILSWNVDKQANECFNTASFKSSVLRIAEMFGYKPRGRIGALVLVDAILSSALTGSSNAIIPARTQIRSLNNLLFETTEKAEIKPGSLTPEKLIATERDATPIGSLLDFISGDPTLNFSADGFHRHSFNVAPGMFIRSTAGKFDEWARIKSVSDDFHVLVLEEPWHNKFVDAFVIRTVDNDTPSSLVALSSVPFGTFASLATATVGAKLVTVETKLLSEVQPGHYFRFNTAECHGNKFFKIASVAADRLSFFLEENFGPVDEGGFDAPSSSFEIESRSLVLVHGESRVEEFLSAESAGFSVSLSSESILAGSIIVQDESGVLDSDGNPAAWSEIGNLALALDDQYRSFEALMGENDTYTLRFGNGLSGKIPIGKVTVTYRVGGGPEGNVLPGSFDVQVNASQGSKSLGLRVTNASTSGHGGSLGETVEEIKTSIPLAHATNKRGVTADDFVFLILNEYSRWSGAIGTVAKANMNNVLNQIYNGGNFLYINCWETENWAPPSRSFSPSANNTFFKRLVPVRSTLEVSLQEFVDGYKMLTDRPLIVKGEVDQAIVEVDVQLEESKDVEIRRVVLQNLETAIVALLNTDSVLNGSPVLLSDVYGAVEGIKGISQVRLRALYLDFEDAADAGNISDTLASLKGVSDLYPRSLNNIIVPGDLSIQVWTVNKGIQIYIEASLYPNIALSKECIKLGLEKFFFALRPGDGFTVEQLKAAVLEVRAGAVKRLPDCRLRSVVNVPLIGTTTTLVVDNVEVELGDILLLDHQTQGAENGLYAVTVYNEEDNYLLTRIPEANSHITLTAGAITTILEGTAADDSFFFSTAQLSSSSFKTGLKQFIQGTEDDADTFLKAVDEDLFSLKLDAPAGSTPDSKSGIPETMYYMKLLQITDTNE
jgi:hypothetical protein